jgi:hypothetical protein
VVVAPYIVDDGVVRRRGVAELVGVAAMLASFAAFWREPSSWVFLFVEVMSIEDLRSRLLLRSVERAPNTESVQVGSWLL